jgi:hypothetical protein
MSYYVVVVGRNYNIAIRATRIGASGETARFRPQLDNCNGRIFAVNCDIDITYDWQDNTPASGTATVTLISGSSQVVDTPTGYTLTSIQITNIIGNSCTYNSFSECGDPLTTTTTTTSTTTTTTTVNPSNPANLSLKYDVFSSSYNPTTGYLENIGNISNYDLTSSYNGGAFIPSGSSGGSSYASINTGFSSGPYFRLASSNPPTINLEGKSFSFVLVFKPKEFSVNETFYPVFDLSNLAIVAARNSGGLTSRLSGVQFVATDLIAGAADAGAIRGLIIRKSVITVTGLTPLDINKWYIAFLDFKYESVGQNEFYFRINNPYFGTPIYTSESPVQMEINSEVNIGTPAQLYTAFDFAALCLKTGSMLTAAEKVSLYNEYNSRYTLG